MNVYIICDNCSTGSYITNHLNDNLGLPKSGKSTLNINRFMDISLEGVIQCYVFFIGQINFRACNFESYTNSKSAGIVHFQNLIVCTCMQDSTGEIVEADCGCRDKGSQQFYIEKPSAHCDWYASKKHRIQIDNVKDDGGYLFIYLRQIS